MGGLQPEQRQARRRDLASLGVAVLVHALVALLAYRLPERPPAHSTAITVELRTVEPREPPATPTDASPKPSRRAAVSLRPDLPVSPKGGGTGGGKGGVAPLARATPPAENAPVPAAPPTAAGDVAPPADDVDLLPEPEIAEGNARWRAEHGLGDGGGLEGQDHGVGDGRGDGSGTGDGDGEGPGAERARITGRIAHDVEETRSKDRVAVGLIDPYFRQLKTGMKEVWHPRASDLGGVDGAGPLAGAFNFLRGAQAVGRQWARTGSPYADGAAPEGLLARREETRAPGGTSGFEAVDFLARWNSGELAFPGGAVVLQLTQRPDGQPLEVKVLVSSGTRVFDLHAGEAVREIARQKLAPPHGLGLGGPTIRSVWKLEAKVLSPTCGMTPDSTGGGLFNGGSGVNAGIVCGGTFDLSDGYLDPEIPFTTKIVTKVTLVAVYGGELRPFTP